MLMTEMYNFSGSMESLEGFEKAEKGYLFIKPVEKMSLKEFQEYSKDYFASEPERERGSEIEKQNEEISKVESGEKSLDSSLEKGNYGEMKTDEVLRQLGYQRISKEMITDIDDPGHQGIDGVYYNSDGYPPYMIVDSKFGTAQLSDTLDGKQMSDKWIDNRLDESVGKEKADEIRMEKLMNPEKVGSYVAHVDEKGNVSFDQLDDNANVVGKDVKINAQG